MTEASEPKPSSCHCLALRQASRSVTQFYDRYLARAGLRTTQFSMLVKLRRLGPMTINALAAELVVDRTTLGRNVLPLERDGLIAIEPDDADRRSKKLSLTPAGAERVRRAVKLWAEAQAQFEATIGRKEAADLRSLLQAAVASGRAGGSANAGE